MLLGKRSRPPMRRTTSMAGFAFDLNAEAPQHENEAQRLRSGPGPMEDVVDHGKGLSRQGPAWKSEGDLGLMAAHFLMACGLCKKMLGPGKDTFMYRGEIAFCSLECRQQQIALDDRKEKCAVRSMKKGPSQNSARSETSSSSETAAAA